MLLCEPLLELVLLVVDRDRPEERRRAGAGSTAWPPLYIGFTVGYGHYTIKWLDGHAAHRFGGGPKPPAKPPKYGMARARHEGRLWLRTVVAAAVALALLQAAVWYVGDDGNVGSLQAWQSARCGPLGIHGLIAARATRIWPRRTGAGSRGRSGTEPPSARTLPLGGRGVGGVATGRLRGPGGRDGSRQRLAARHPQHVPDLLVRRPGQDEQEVGEAVEVGRGQRVHRLAVRLQGRPGGALGAPDHRARLVQQGRAGGAAGQDEAAQLLQLAQ